MPPGENAELRIHPFRCACGSELHIAQLYVGRLTFCPHCAGPICVPTEEGGTATVLAPQIEEGTISLRPAGSRDWETLFPIRSDPRNYAFELAIPESAKALKRTLKYAAFPKRFAQSRLLRFLISRWGGSEDGTVIGTISLSLSEDHLSADVGIMIHHPYQAQGFGKQALQGVSKLAFDQMGLHRLGAACDAENAACVALFLNAGFRDEGRIEKLSLHRQRGWIDHRLFGKLDDEWKA